VQLLRNRNTLPFSLLSSRTSAVTPDPNPVAKNSPVVLIANDQEWTARAVESILMASGYRTHRAHTATETLAMAERLDPDVVILDQQLPDFSGTEVCRRLRADPAFGAALPIMITTAGPSGRQQRVAAYEAGAWEFYGQPLDAEALLNKLTVYCASYQEVRRLRQETLVDQESGLYSRPGLTRRATELLGEARRSQRDVSCVVWDIPQRLDPIQVANIGQGLRRQGRAADAFGRLDTNRFAVVAPGASSAGVERFRGIFRESLADREIEVNTTVITRGHDTLPENGWALLEAVSPAMAA
jgi:DNA-binding response OmpR family regulator